MEVLISFIILAIVSIPAHKVASLLKRFHIPVVSGLLLFGLLINPFGLDLVAREHLDHLNFVTDFSLIFIALAAGSELYLKDFRSRVGGMLCMCIGQTFGVFIVALFGVYATLGLFPSLGDFLNYRWEISALFAALFVARSPSTMIAMMGELRAKGPFTSMALGVTVLMDVVVIILFMICIQFAIVSIEGVAIDYTLIAAILLGLGLSVGLGFAVGRLICLILNRSIGSRYKIAGMIAMIYGVQYFIHWLADFSENAWGMAIHVEALLTFIVSGFYLVNYSSHRYEFSTILEQVMDYVYVLFFTLTGLTMSLDELSLVGVVAVVFFFIRLGAIILGSFLGAVMAGESRQFMLLSWMPHITQAGIALGLAKMVEMQFPAWGADFSTLAVALLIVNQLIGPFFLKWSIQKAGEAHVWDDRIQGNRHIVIFGFEALTVALARQLFKNKYSVEIVSLLPERDLQPVRDQYPEISIHALEQVTEKHLTSLSLKKDPEKIVLLFSDNKSIRVCEFLQKKHLKSQWVVRLNDRSNFDYFHNFGALIIEPSTAMVSLFDQFVRSPSAVSLLLGMEAGQSTVDIKVRNEEIFGLSLRELRFPKDIIVLSVKRSGQIIISHGFTRLLRGDILTLVGDSEALEKIKLKFS